MNSQTPALIPTVGAGQVLRPVVAEEARPGGEAIPVIEFVVYGDPAGQGRISFFGPGRAKHSNEKELKKWRRAVADAALKATGRHQYVEFGTQTWCAVCRVAKKEHPLLVDVPVAADITVTVEKPKTAPKRRRTWPITRYSTDVDHHARAALDAISESGIWWDDAQVVELTVRKVYPGEHVRALGRTGALIRVWPLGGAA